MQALTLVQDLDIHGPDVVLAVLVIIAVVFLARSAFQEAKAKVEEKLNE